MAKDPAFLFYPGDYLRDTQTLSEKTQVAYDRIMCEHMRNICISKQQLKFFTKKLSEEETQELIYVLTEVEGGYQIEWVAESVNKRKAFSESRRRNRQKKKEEDINNTSKTYVKHMEIENENENKDELIIGMGHEFLIEVCSFFSQTQQAHKERVCNFLNILAKNKQFNQFRSQTKAYMSYKTNSGERVHQWASYQQEWENTDWVHKNSKTGKEELTVEIN